MVHEPSVLELLRFDWYLSRLDKVDWITRSFFFVVFFFPTFLQAGQLSDFLFAFLLHNKSHMKKQSFVAYSWLTCTPSDFWKGSGYYKRKQFSALFFQRRIIFRKEEKPFWRSYLPWTNAYQLPLTYFHYENTPIQIYWKLYNQKKRKFSDKKFWYFSYFCSKHRLWVLVRTASVRRF